MKPIFPTIESQLQVCSQYEQGKSAVDIAKENGVESTSIYRLLKKHGVLIRNNSECKRQLKYNSTFFDTYTELSCYWAGFIAGDGNVSGHELSVCSQLSDKAHIQKYKEELQSEHKLQEKENSCRLSIKSVELCSALFENFSITPAKSLTLEYPSKLPQEMNQPFIRGYFDADGCFTFNMNKKANCHISFAGTFNFLKETRELLMENCCLNKVHIFKQKPSSIYILSYSGKKQVQRIFEYLYKDATVFLERKYEKLKSFIY